MSTAISRRRFLELGAATTALSSLPTNLLADEIPPTLRPPTTSENYLWRAGVHALQDMYAVERTTGNNVVEPVAPMINCLAQVMLAVDETDQAAQSSLRSFFGAPANADLVRIAAAITDDYARSAIPATGGTWLHQAYEMWLAQDLTPDPYFLNRYQRGLTPTGSKTLNTPSHTDFHTMEHRDMINAWIKALVGNRIPPMITSPLDRDTAYVVASAIDWKDLWHQKFDSRNTTSQKFSGLDASGRPMEFSVPMMHAENVQGRYALLRNGDEYAAKPFANGFEFFYVKAGDGNIGRLVGELATVMDEIHSLNLRLVPMTFNLPHINIATGKVNLVPALSAGLVSPLLSNQTRFRMVSGNNRVGKISLALSSSRVDVDENGGSGSGVVVMGGTRGLIALEKPIVASLDRTAIFGVRSTSPQRPQVPLFLGVLKNPTLKK